MRPRQRSGVPITVPITTTTAEEEEEDEEEEDDERNFLYSKPCLLCGMMQEVQAISPTSLAMVAAVMLLKDIGFTFFSRKALSIAVIPVNCKSRNPLLL